MKSAKSEEKNLRVVARGSNSEVIEFGDGANKLALKIVREQASKERRHLANEAEVLSKVRHPNIIRALKYEPQVALPILDGPSAVLVLEHASHGTMLDCLRKRRLGAAEIRFLFAEVLSAVKYLHRNFIVHRDLKLQNVLLSANASLLTVKLADFGFAQPLKDAQEMLATCKGTPKAYMAPEIRALHQTRQPYLPMPADIFALGVLLFAAALGHFPFEAASASNRLYGLLCRSPAAFWKQHCTGLEALELQEDSQSAHFQALFESMVAQHPEDRPTIQEIGDHPWTQARKQQVPV